MGRAKEGQATRERLADALLGLMEERDPAKIGVGELAAAAGVNRQTFYYHFADIYELAEYACDRGIARIFGVDSVDETFERFSPSEHTVTILRELKRTPKGLRNLLYFFTARNAKGHFYELVRRRAQESFSRELKAAGLSQAQVAMYEDLWATAVVALVMDWLHGNVPLDADAFAAALDHVSEVILADAVAGGWSRA